MTTKKSHCRQSNGLLQPRNMWIPKPKKVFAAKLVGFQFKWGRKKNLHHKSVEIWFHFIIWCHPKLVTPGAPPPPSPSLRHLCCTTGTYINTVPLISTRLSKTKLCFAESRDSRGKLQRLPLPCSFTSHCEAFFTLESTKKTVKT